VLWVQRQESSLKNLFFLVFIHELHTQREAGVQLDQFIRNSQAQRNKWNFNFNNRCCFRYHLYSIGTSHWDL